MKKRINFLLAISLLSLGFSSCIGDDFIEDQVDPVVRITSSVNSIAVGESFQLEAIFLNNIGIQESVEIFWSSSDPNIISIESTGLATAHEAGIVTITARYINGDVEIEDAIEVEASSETNVDPNVASGQIVTTSSYILEGDFEVIPEGNGIRINIADNYRASSSLPGLYLYLTNNANSIAAAREVSMVTIFNGSHSYFIDQVDITDYQYLLYYCKPFNVKVGDGQINL